MISLNICVNLKYLHLINQIKIFIYILIIFLCILFLFYYIKTKSKKKLIILILLITLLPITHLLAFTLGNFNFPYAKCLLFSNDSYIEKIKKEVKYMYSKDSKVQGNMVKYCIGEKSCYINKLPIVTKENYFFLGWSKNKKCNNPAKDKIEIFDDQSLYACFDKIVYIVSFDSNLGELSGEKEIKISIDNNYEISDLPIATKDNNIFLGWSQNKECNTIENGVLKINDSITYYACYKENPKTINNSNLKNEGICSNGTKYNILTANGITTINGIMIVNKSYSLPSTYDAEGLSANGLLPEAQEQFDKMKIEANKNGLSIWNQSGYRSYASQKIIYNSYLSYDSQAVVDTYSARPGNSEHQTGLVTDINLPSSDPISGFDVKYPSESNWLHNNAYIYGFILRYPEGKQNITGYQYEPWHYRYVGEELAKKLYNNGSWITLEEYFCISSRYP